MEHRMLSLPKRNIAFFSIIGVLLFTSFINVPCPVCGGTGNISTSVNMDFVLLGQMDTTLKLQNADLCQGYTLYIYDISLTLTNDATEEAKGWVSLFLKSRATGDILDTQYMGVQIDAKSTFVDSFTVYFSISYDKTQEVYVEAQADAGAVSCLACGGDGRMPSSLWALADGARAKLAEVTRTERTFVPPPPAIFPAGD